MEYLQCAHAPGNETPNRALLAKEVAEEGHRAEAAKLTGKLTVLQADRADGDIGSDFLEDLKGIFGGARAREFVKEDQNL